ncbi:energy transducer TonB [Hymenobacter fodinae]|uniref:Energy transducer TonB n=1 Tax=Hymenobacter fodinae TaxID=2510796 RepID=A0A4Z0PD89_9BACT|nr:energy transducer TonB [Hymenobacter fodinae]TGE09619.1 energy transducer TonB [Hymenobacter fodinae]
MLPLPILNVKLNTCQEDWQQMTPVALGHHCAQCDRVVINFTTSSQADLAAAFQNSPDGRVCGRFRPEQLAPRPLLRQKLRRFLVALVLVCGLGLSGQEALAQVRKVAAKAQQVPDNWLGMVVEQMPKYKDGSQEALQKYIKQTLHYPSGAKASGKIFISFIVTKTGQVANVEVVKGLEPLLDKEAIRVVRQMGNWTPGQQQNRPVDVRYTLPITFTLR